jgi:uracil-DNA glycosylase
MENHYNTLKQCILNIKPTFIFMLGAMVSDFLLSKYSINTRKDAYQKLNFSKLFKVNNTILVSIYHPSYMYVYKRSRITEYIDEIFSIMVPEQRQVFL